MPWFPNPNGGAPIQAATNPNPAGGSYGLYSDPGYNGPAPSVGGASSPAPTSAPTSSGPPAPTGTTAAVQAAQGVQGVLGAAASGNKAALDETIREFNQTFGLDTNKFNDDVRRFNENLAISQSGLTGVYQGQQTQAAQKQAADISATQAGLTGVYNSYAPGSYLRDPATGAIYGVAPSGQVQYIGDPNAVPQGVYIQNVPGLGGPVQTPTGFFPASMAGGQQGQETLAAQAQYAGLYGGSGAPPTAGQTTLAAQQQAYTQQMGAINAAAALQANPFRQAQVIGQAGRILQGMPTAGFSAPNTVTGVGTAGGNTQGGMGYLQQLIDDIKSPAANQTTAQSWLDATPTPNKIDSASFLRSTPTTQNLILQSMQEKYGLDPTDSMAQIKNTLPQFNAPSTVGTVRRG